MSEDVMLTVANAGYDFHGCDSRSCDDCACATWEPAICPVCDEEIRAGEEIYLIVRDVSPWLPEDDRDQNWDTTEWHKRCDQGSRAAAAAAAAAPPLPPLADDRGAMMLGLVPDKRTPAERLYDAARTNGESLKYRYCDAVDEDGHQCGRTDEHDTHTHKLPCGCTATWVSTEGQ